MNRRDDRNGFSSVVDGHEVFVTEVDDRCAHHFLEEVGAGTPVSQRRLARELGMALGLANLLVRRVAGKGWVRIVRIKPNRVRYFLTPAGFAEKARMSRRLLQQSVRYYASARKQVRAGLIAASQAGAKRVVFFGVNELTEIAFVSLQETELHLVGIVSHEAGPDRFLGHRVHPPNALDASALDGVPFDHVLVTVLDGREFIESQLQMCGVDAARISWL